MYESLFIIIMLYEILFHASNDIFFSISVFFSFFFLETTQVPANLVKFSLSATIKDVNVKTCDTEYDLADLHIRGLCNDFIWAAC